MEAKDWKAAVNMYRAKDLWDDAYRVGTVRWRGAIAWREEGRRMEEGVYNKGGESGLCFETGLMSSITLEQKIFMEGQCITVSVPTFC